MAAIVPDFMQVCLRSWFVVAVVPCVTRWLSRLYLLQHRQQGQVRGDQWLNGALADRCRFGMVTRAAALLQSDAFMSNR